MGRRRRALIQDGRDSGPHESGGRKEVRAAWPASRSFCSFVGLPCVLFSEVFVEHHAFARCNWAALKRTCNSVALAFSAHQLEKVFDADKPHFEIARPAVLIESPDLTCRDLVALKRFASAW